MNIIKGLVIKDLLQLKSYKKNFFISLIIYILFILTNDLGMAPMFAAMIMFLFSSYAIATFNYDEISRFDKYALVFPLKKKDVVLSKYVLCLLSLIIGLIVSVAIIIALTYFKLKVFLILPDLFATLFGSIVIFSLIQSIQIPLIYKYGAEKGRLQIYIVMMIFFVGGGIILANFPNLDLSFIDNFSLILFILLVIFNYFISFKISCLIYEKKEA